MTEATYTLTYEEESKTYYSSRHFELVLPKEKVEQLYTELYDPLVSITEAVEHESREIATDSHYQGKFLELARLWVKHIEDDPETFTFGPLQYDYHELETIPDEDCPIEYWGSFSTLQGSSPFSTYPRFPWMSKRFSPGKHGNITDPPG